MLASTGTVEKFNTHQRYSAAITNVFKANAGEQKGGADLKVRFMDSSRCKRMFSVLLHSRYNALD